MSAKVMVVDDMEPRLGLTFEILKGAGYEVLCISDVPKAMSEFQGFAPECCVLEYHMPQMLSSELARLFKEMDPSVEIVFLTGQDDADRVLASISRALDHRRLVQENRDYRWHLESMVAQQTAALKVSLRRMKRLSTAALQTLGVVLDFRDQSTSGHSQRVASNTTAIAAEIGISGDQLLSIEQGAFLHDIGKLKIPDSILLKPGKLTADEWQAMRLHPHHGREFLAQIDFLADAAQLVFAHHEKFDGSGYPQGLKGEDIPIGARIFSIVDAIDAMTCTRPYNRPIAMGEALEEIRRCAGTHFDPEIAELTIANARRGALATAV